jgi:CAAX protease family protein
LRFSDYTEEIIMKAIANFIRRYPQAVFWAIAYGVFFGGYVMYMLFPSDLWQYLIWGVALGGLFVTAVADGRSGVKVFFSRIVRWRVGIQWYAVALLLPLVLRLGAYGLNILFGAQPTTSLQLPPWPELIGSFLFIFFTVSLGEEPGFRGFALPRLLIGRTAIAASLILGVLHAFWHLPLFLFAGDPPLQTILIVISGSVIFTWMFNHTRGSVLLAMLLHASVDLWTPVFNPLFSGTEAMRQSIWLTALYVLTAILIALLAGRELGRKLVIAAQPVAQDQPLAAD